MRALARFKYSHLFHSITGQIGAFMATKKIKLSPRKLPRQERSAFMVNTILQAATRVLSEESLEGFNTNRVANVAGISVGSLYQYFPNKSSLIATLIEREHELLCSELEKCLMRCRGKSLRAVVESFVELAVNQQHENPRFSAALDHEEQHLPIKKELHIFQRRIGLILISAIKEHLPALPACLPAETAQDLLTIAKAMVENEAVTTRVQRVQLQVRLTRAILGYLQFQDV
jgi:AcrR family transcriptional regulator